MLTFLSDGSNYSLDEAKTIVLFSRFSKNLQKLCVSERMVTGVVNLHFDKNSDVDVFFFFSDCTKLSGKGHWKIKTKRRRRALISGKAT